MGKYTSKLTNPTDNWAAKEQAKVDEQRRQREIQRFRQNGVMGTTDIDAKGMMMAEIAARFVNNSVNALEDPAFDMVQFQINWLAEYGLFADERYNESALRYLNETGEIERYNALQDVIALLKQCFDATTNSATSAYRLKSVDGISEINDNYRNVGVYSHIQLNVFEDIKWTMRAINNKLEFIMYDNVRQIEVLPKNLRCFSWFMTIMDCRDLREVLRNPANAEQADNNLFVSKDNQLQSMFVSCPVSFFEPVKVLPETLDNTEPAELQASLRLLCGPIRISLIMPALFYMVDEPVHKDEGNTKKITFWSQVGQAVKAYAASMVAGYVKSAVNMAQSYAMAVVANQLDKWGVTDAINGALKYTKPSLLMQSFSNALDDLLGLSTKVNQETYKQTLGKIDYTEPADTTYRTTFAEQEDDATDGTANDNTVTDGTQNDRVFGTLNERVLDKPVVGETYKRTLGNIEN